MTDSKALIKSARRREATYRLCVRGDLAAEHQALEEQLAVETGKGGWTATSLADANPLVEMAERIAAIEAEMAESTATLRLRALRRHDWDTLLAEHKKDDDTQDIAALAPALVRMCIIDPEFTASEFDDLWDDVLNEGQRDELFSIAFAVNTEATTVPFSERASVVTRWRAERSKQPEPGASPEASS